jgi:hypothetical protein
MLRGSAGTVSFGGERTPTRAAKPLGYAASAINPIHDLSTTLRRSRVTTSNVVPLAVPKRLSN